MNLGPWDLGGSQSRVGESRDRAGKVSGIGDASRKGRLRRSDDVRRVGDHLGHRIRRRDSCHLVDENERNSSIEISRFRAGTEGGHQANGRVRPIVTAVTTSGIKIDLVAGGAGVVAGNGEAAVFAGAHIVTGSVSRIAGSGGEQGD